MERFDRIEGLRAPLAWWVFVAHAMQWAAIDPASLPAFVRPLYLGIVPVYGFMMISGFVITHLITKRRERYLPYIVRRYLRLAPLMALTIPLAALTDLFAGPQSFWPSDYLWLRVLLQLSLFHGVLPDSVLPGSSMMFANPGWSVSLEWQFYLLAPLLVAAIHKGGWRLVAPLGLLVLAVSMGLADNARQAMLPGATLAYAKPSMLLCAIVYFLIGIGLHMLFMQTGPVRRHGALFVLLICLALFFEPRDGGTMLWQVAPMGALIAFVIFWDKSLVAKVLASPIPKWLGRVSYSTYLLHFFVLAFATSILRPHIGDGMALFWAILAVSAPLTVLASAIGYYGVEAPFMRLGARLTSRKEEPVSQAVVLTAP